MNKQTMKQTFRSTVIVIALLMIGTIHTNAQDDDGFSIQSTILDKAQQTINSYASAATISSEQRAYEFQELFSSRNSSVYNDLIGITERQGNSMTPENYAQKLRDPRLSNTRVTLRDISYGTPFRDPAGGGWRIIVTFTKEISYDIDGQLYSNNGIRLKAILKYESDMDRCLIERISGSLGRSETSRTRNNSSNSPWRLRATFGLGLGEALSVSGSSSKDFDKGKSSGMGFGAEIGYTVADYSNLKLTAFAGLGITTSQLKDLGFNGDYTFQTNADVDGDTYLRTYQGLSIIQTVKLTELSIPIYIDAELPFGDQISAYADLGLRLNMNMGNSLSSGATVNSIYGTYGAYNNIKFDKEWGFNGFDQSGNLKTAKNDIEGLAGFNADLLASIGFRYKAIDKLQLDLGVSYLMGLSNVMKDDDVKLNGSDIKIDGTNSKPIIYNTIDYNMESSEHVRSITDALDGVKHKSLRLNIGLIYNF